MRARVNEPNRVRERYERRKRDPRPLYHPLDPSTYMRVQEKERKLIRLLVSCGLTPLRDKRVLDVGCGSGGDLLQLVRLGFDPHKLVGCDLLEERADAARHRLPAACSVLTGDASTLSFEEESFDIVMQSTVFTSLLDIDYQQQLADRMWQLTNEDGGIVWYDFAYDNPRNPDVRGIRLRRVRELFPAAEVRVWRTTLAPPISRRVTPIHPQLYSVFNALPLLRTHLLCWIAR